MNILHRLAHMFATFGASISAVSLGYNLLPDVEPVKALYWVGISSGICAILGKGLHAFVAPVEGAPQEPTIAIPAKPEEQPPTKIP